MTGPPNSIPSKAFQKVYTKRWLESTASHDHPIREALLEGKRGCINLSKVDEKLQRLDSFGLLDKRLIYRLRNRYRDTMEEIDVILHLRDRSIDGEWGSEPPDIEVKSLNVGIEVKCLHVCDELTASRGKAIVVDDIRRMELRVEDRGGPLKRFEDSDIINILVLTGVLGIDEIHDLFVSTTSRTFDLHTGRWTEEGGLFSEDRFSPISAVVGKECGKYHGFANWKARREVDEVLSDAFDIRMILPCR